MEQIIKSLEQIVSNCFQPHYKCHIKTVPQEDIPNNFCIHVIVPTDKTKNKTTTIRVIIPNESLTHPNIEEKVESFTKNQIDETIKLHGDLGSIPKGYRAWKFAL